MDIETESHFIRQEHRFWWIIYNFFTRYDRFPDASDPRRAACVSAFCWNLLLSPSAVATSGGIVALVTIGLLWWQNQLLQENNSLIASSINPEQLYVISIADEFQIIRTVTEGNQGFIEDYPLGVGSVLIADLNISCSGKSPLILENIRFELNFTDDSIAQTVRFIPYPRDTFRKVIQPGEILIVDVRLVPEITSNHRITSWPIDRLGSGKLHIEVSGRDVFGREWRLEEGRHVKRPLSRTGSYFAIDSTTEYNLPPKKFDISADVSSAIDLPEGNRNRVIGSFSLGYLIETTSDEHSRIVAQLKCQD